MVVLNVLVSVWSYFQGVQNERFCENLIELLRTISLMVWVCLCMFSRVAYHLFIFQKEPVEIIVMAKAIYLLWLRNGCFILQYIPFRFQFFFTFLSFYQVKESETL